MSNNVTPHIVRVTRLTRLLFHILSGVMQSIAYPFFPYPTQNRMMKNWARGILKILNIRLHCTGKLPNQSTQQALFVANHVSWLDICLVMAVSPTQFVAKSEIRNWPVVGFLCRRVGTLFIERAKRRDTMRINQKISNVLMSGERVCIFPEGGTSDGTQTRHFHSSLLQSAINTDALLFPIAIRYLDKTGAPCTDAAYTDLSLMTSLQKILRQPHIEAVINCNQPICSTGRNRRELARLCEEIIAGHLSQPVYHNESEKPSYLPNA